MPKDAKQTLHHRRVPAAVNKHRISSSNWANIHCTQCWSRQPREHIRRQPPKLGQCSERSTKTTEQTCVSVNPEQRVPRQRIASESRVLRCELGHERVEGVLRADRICIANQTIMIVVVAGVTSRFAEGLDERGQEWIGWMDANLHV
jgi:hypothetical protein